MCSCHYIKEQWTHLKQDDGLRGVIMNQVITCLFMLALLVSQAFFLYESIITDQFLGIFLSILSISIAVLVIYSECVTCWKEHKEAKE